MPNSARNAVTAPDNYTDGSTLDAGVFIDHVNLDVYNQAIYWQIKQASRRGDTAQKATWQAEVQMGVGSRTISRPGLVGIRFRAFTPAAQLPAGSTQAVVTAEVVT